MSCQSADGLEEIKFATWAANGQSPGMRMPAAARLSRRAE